MSLQFQESFTSRKEVCFMYSCDLQSVFAENINNYILLKRNLGLKFRKEVQRLKNIDRFAIESNEKGPGLTKEFCDSWLNSTPNQSHRTKYCKCSTIRNFSIYLTEHDIVSHIPNLPRYKKNEHIPYIYSNEEIALIFNAADSLRAPLNVHTGLFSMPALIRFLYATGLRIGEAILLKNMDVNLGDKYIKVCDVKNKKERLLPISDSLTEVLLSYLLYKNYLVRPYITDYFFIKTDGQKLTHALVSTHFKRCLNTAGVLGDDNLSRPRIHDLRHTFAVNCLAKIVESGNDPYIAIPILSKYLGHKTVASSNTYVRLTANMYPEVIKNLELYIIDVFPKNEDHEAY